MGASCWQKISGPTTSSSSRSTSRPARSTRQDRCWPHRRRSAWLFCRRLREPLFPLLLFGHLGHEGGRALLQFVRRQIFLVGRDLPLVTLRIDDLTVAITPELV